MFRRMQLKMALYYTLILIAILLVTNFSIYFSLQTYNNYQLSVEMSSLISGISDSEWLKEESHESEDEEDDEEENESLEEKANEVTFFDNNELLIPAALDYVSFYFIFDANDQLLKFSIPNQNLLIPLNQQLKTLTLGLDPEVISFDIDQLNYYLVMKKPIVIDGQWYGYFYAGRDVTPAFETLNNLKQILIISLIAGVLLSLLIGYLIAGRAIRPIKEAYEIKQRFLADASHELRTPLSVIMLSTEVLLREIDTAESLKYSTVKDIKEEAKKMSYLVENLLQLARTDRHNEISNMLNIDFSNTVSNAVASFKYPAKEKQIVIDANIASNIQVYGDEKLLATVVTVLLDNAVKYTNSGGKIIASLQQVKNKIKFSVEDTGIGIAADEIDKIFDRFYRHESSRSRKTGGYGLGLSIAKKIVENHGGYIQVSSQPGKGSIFTVYLDTPNHNNKTQ